MKAWIDNLLYKIRKRRFCKLNRWFCPDCIYHDFIFEGAIFKGNNCRFPRKGADTLERLVKTEPQKKEVEWVYNKRERLWYPYSNGEPLFKTENSISNGSYTHGNFTLLVDANGNPLLYNEAERIEE